MPQTAAISSGAPWRPSGTRAIWSGRGGTCVSPPSGAIGPGEIALTVTPWGPNSRASALVESPDAVLRRRDMRAVGGAHDRVQAGEIDDPTPALRDHPGQEGAGEVHRRVEVDLDDATPIRLAHLEKTLVRTDRRVVDEDIDRPELVQRRPGEALRLVGRPDIAHQHHHFDAERLCLSRHGLAIRPIARPVDNDVAAAPRQIQRDRPADIPSRA